MTHGRPVHLSDYRVGDKIFSNAQPDPQRALVYQARSIFDLDLVPVKKSRGLILDVGQAGDTITVRLGDRPVLVDISRSTRIELPTGKPGTLADLQTGNSVTITGVRNKRLDEVTTTSLIRLTEVPRKKPSR
jgi:hypothetical protein